MWNKSEPSNTNRMKPICGKCLNLKRISLIVVFVFTGLMAVPQTKLNPIVNQTGYNLYEAKRFVCYGAKDGTPFEICMARDSLTENVKILFSGTIQDFAGDFSGFNPKSKEEFVIKVEGHGYSYPFWIADHLMEITSSKLAYDFFVDVRGSEDPKTSPARITGGGPSRDGGGQTLEALYEILFYASNPALFDRWTIELRNIYSPDLIDLILWHAEFCYNNIDYKGGNSSHNDYPFDYVTIREYGYKGQEKQLFDRQNMLDQLAAVCAAYHPFLEPYLDEETYQKYRKSCLDHWENYDRHKEVRYWVNSFKWIDEGYREFNEQGNAFGQGLFRNLMMYICEKNEADGNPAKFLKYAQECATDIIDNWDFENEWHTWAVRNAEHITPQALAFFQMTFPDLAPDGTIKKLEKYRDYVFEKTNNFWHYRKHSNEEWAHPKSKEVGTVSGLGGSFFATAHLINDPELRALAWSQVNFVFGLNPVQAHLSYRDAVRVKRNGYWKGVDKGWPFESGDGTGELDEVRGTLDGSPSNDIFPYNPQKLFDGTLDKWYHTEGWAITNRAWMSSVIFSTLGTHSIKIYDESSTHEMDKPKTGEIINVQLKAALNLDWEQKESAWVLVQIEEETPFKLPVIETETNSGIFTGKLHLNYPGKSEIKISYGYWGFEKMVKFTLPARTVKVSEYQ